MDLGGSLCVLSSGGRRLYLGLAVAGLLATALSLARTAPSLPYGSWAPWALLPLGFAAFGLALRLVWEEVQLLSLKGGRLFALCRERIPLREGAIYVGRGFDWTAAHAERLWETAGRGLEPPLGLQATLGGNPLFHSLGLFEERDQFLECRRLPQHCLVLGSPGWGKSRFLEMLGVQLVRQGDVVIVLDPKGDRRLLNALVEAAQEAGRRGEFRLVAPPWSKASCSYNPLSSYSSAKEIADRIMGIFTPAPGESEVFRGYQWGAVHAVAQAIEMADLPMTLANVLRYVRNPSELFGLLVDRRYKDPLGAEGPGRAADLYARLVSAGSFPARPDLDDLLAYARESPSHYGKMTGGLRPQLERLSAGVYREILSADPGTDARDSVSWSGLLHRGGIAYFYLGTLHGEESAKALGKMILLDFQSFIAQLYSYRPEGNPRRICLLIDEAHAMISKPFLNILAEGRGANVACILATQTTAQFEEAMGSRAAVNEILTNCQAHFQFQSRNPEECRSFSDLVGQRRLRRLGEGHRYEAGFWGSGLRTIDDFRATYSQNITWQDSELVPAWTIAQLPSFHCFARMSGRTLKIQIPLLDPPRSTFCEDLLQAGAAE